MAAFIPGASPPDVNTPILVTFLTFSIVGYWSDNKVCMYRQNRQEIGAFPLEASKVHISA
jgi:hypothetical protein